MFGHTVSRSIRRSGTLRRTVIRRASLAAAISCLALGLTVAEPLAAALPTAGQAHADHARGERSGRGRGERRPPRTVMRSYTSPAPVIINDVAPASPYPSTITVANNRRGRVVDVNVVLRGLTHTYADDVDILLMAPDGRSTILMSDVGDASSPVGLTLMIDDDASNFLQDAGPLVGGVFKPANYGGVDSFPAVSSPPTAARLSRLNGGDPNGDWRLYVMDDEGGFSGEISSGWELQLWVEYQDTHNRRRDRR